MSSLLHGLVTFHGTIAYLIVGALCFGEASVFGGFVLPGETAVVLGGVLASFHHVSLVRIIVPVVVCAIAGDSVTKWGVGSGRPLSTACLEGPAAVQRRPEGSSSAGADRRCSLVASPRSSAPSFPGPQDSPPCVTGLFSSGTRSGDCAGVWPSASPATAQGAPTNASSRQQAPHRPRSSPLRSSPERVCSSGTRCAGVATAKMRPLNPTIPVATQPFLLTTLERFPQLAGDGLSGGMAPAPILNDAGAAEPCRPLVPARW